MNRPTQRIAASVLFFFFAIFNLAIPLNAADLFGGGQCGLRGSCCAGGTCCCCRKGAPPDDDIACGIRGGCSREHHEGVVCNALDHVTLAAEETLLRSVHAEEPFRLVDERINAAFYPLPPEKPPRTSLS